jgi:hypothetical protein
MESLKGGGGGASSCFPQPAPSKPTSDTAPTSATWEETARTDLAFIELRVAGPVRSVKPGRMDKNWLRSMRIHRAEKHAAWGGRLSDR